MGASLFSSLITFVRFNHGEVLAAGRHRVDDVILVVRLNDTDLEKTCADSRADQHRELMVFGSSDRCDRVVDGVSDVIVGDSVLAGTRKNLHPDNCSCHLGVEQPMGINSR